MALSAFDDKSHPPSDEAIAAVLGRTFPLWNDLQRLIGDRFAPISPAWGYASRSSGWGLRLKQGERIVLYMTPCIGHFLVSFVLGDKAVQAAHARKFPAALLATIDAAKKYAEGRGVRFEIRTARMLDDMVRLAEVKMAP